MKCECDCGNKAQLVRTDVLGNCRYLVCANCEIDLVNISLSKKQFMALLKNGHTTEEHSLHDDFYDEKGTALQPRFGG